MRFLAAKAINEALKAEVELSILSMRFQVAVPLGRVGCGVAYFQFSLWDSYDKRHDIRAVALNPFNSLYEIHRQPQRVQAGLKRPDVERSKPFQFSLWDSTLQWVETSSILPPLSILSMRFPLEISCRMHLMAFIFQFSLWDSMG